MSRNLTILTFAWVRTETGEPELSHKTNAATVGDLLNELIANRPNWAGLEKRKDEICCALNRAFAALDTPLDQADEVAFFPPVTGG